MEAQIAKVNMLAVGAYSRCGGGGDLRIKGAVKPRLQCSIIERLSMLLRPQSGKYARVTCLIHAKIRTNGY